jgi:glutathione synthase/RimK-type ligase-like ATP-grasp enzyme
MIALVSSQEWPDLGPDDAHLTRALDAAGVACKAVPWDTPGEDWSSYDAAIIRATWDYFHRAGEFTDWLQARRADGTTLWNPADVLAWNMRKDYLRDLADHVPVADTEWLAPGDDVADALAKRGWDRAVLKPVVSAGGWRTTVVTPRDATTVEGADPMMLQPFLPQIVDEGEWSFVFFDNSFSHAFLKRPAAGNFLVQERHGGSVHPVQTPPPTLLASAERVLAAAPADLLYARVDGVRTGAELTLLELEVFEPVLYFGAAPGTAERFVRALLARM